MSQPIWNGTCDNCHEDIYGSRFDCRKGEFHPECAADLGLICHTCHRDECECPEVLNEIAHKEAA
jgi:hypothetical protein